MPKPNKTRKHSPGWAKAIAKERIHALFKLASRVHPRRKQLAQRYVEHARRLGTRNRVHIPAEYQRTYCKSCNAFLKVGDNARVRLSQKSGSHLVYTCLNCNAVTRIPYKKNKNRPARKK